MRPNLITRTFISLNVANDFAYFGFFAIQFMLLKATLQLFNLPLESTSLAVTLIASQLIWQILAEGPTGAFADNYGRARAVSASFFFRVLGIGLILAAILMLSTQEPGTLIKTIAGIILIASQVAIATGEALLEGSIEAWLRDEMEIASPSDFEKRVDYTFGRSAIAQNIAVLTASPLFLAIWTIENNSVMILAGVSALVFLIGGIIAANAAKHERFVKTNSTVRESNRIINTIRRAIVALVKSESPRVRKVVLLLILPFPCWILLSWFFTAFAKSPFDLVNTPGLLEKVLPWLGLSLGIGRVAGAWFGNRITAAVSTNKLTHLFGKSVLINILLLFSAGAILVMGSFLNVSFPLIYITVLFVLLSSLAKGSEEVVKLSKNRLLAVIVSDSAERATILSLLSVCQNIFAFITLAAVGILVTMVNPVSSGVVIQMFCICGAIGLLWVFLFSLKKKD